jgi:hypothetical protein
MPALATERLPDFYGSYPARRTIRVAANVKIFRGALVAIDNAGRSMPAGLLAGGTVRAVGVASATYDNTGGAADAFKVEMTVGTFKFKNHGADLVTSASVGADCYIVDDQTVALTDGGGTRAVAGKVQMVEADGVRVHVV